MGCYLIFFLAVHGALGDINTFGNDDSFFVVEARNYLLPSCEFIPSGCVCVFYFGCDVGFAKFSNFGMVECVVVVDRAVGVRVLFFESTEDGVQRTVI